MDDIIWDDLRIEMETMVLSWMNWQAQWRNN